MLMEQVSANNDIIQLGIVTYGAWIIKQSNLTIPGYPQYNNTVVRCNACRIWYNGNMVVITTLIAHLV